MDTAQSNISNNDPPEIINLKLRRRRRKPSEIKAEKIAKAEAKKSEGLTPEKLQVENQLENHPRKMEAQNTFDHMSKEEKDLLRFNRKKARIIEKCRLEDQLCTESSINELIETLAQTQIDLQKARHSNRKYRDNATFSKAFFMHNKRFVTFKYAEFWMYYFHLRNYARDNALEKSKGVCEFEFTTNAEMLIDQLHISRGKALNLIQFFNEVGAWVVLDTKPNKKITYSFGRRKKHFPKDGIRYVIKYELSLDRAGFSKAKRWYKDQIDKHQEQWKNGASRREMQRKNRQRKW